MYLVTLVRSDGSMKAIAPVESLKEAEGMIEKYQEARNWAAGQGMVKRSAKEYRILEINADTAAVKTVPAENTPTTDAKPVTESTAVN